MGTDMAPVCASTGMLWINSVAVLIVKKFDPPGAEMKNVVKILHQKLNKKEQQGLTL